MINQRNKGAAYEREVAAYLRLVLGADVKRNLDQSRDGGHDLTLGRFRIECKRRAKVAIYDWFHQIERATKAGEIPVLCIRADREKRLWVIDDEAMMRFLSGEMGE